MSVPDIVHDLLQRERQRCEALERFDVTALRRLLAPDLVHVHTRGNTDDLESYLHYITHTIRVLQVTRQGLQVRLQGNDCAVMTGRQTHVAIARVSQTPPVTVDTQVMQVWTRYPGDGWMMAAFQATLVGPAPPPLQAPVSSLGERA